jgi:polar amino acid transport system substrate-binding protein
MTSQSRRRLIAGLLAALPLAFAVSGCATDTRPEERTGPSASYNRALHAALPANVRRSGVLRVATDASYAPASSFAPDGRTIVGFEPDLGAALGRVLGVKVRFTNTDFARVLPDVAAHRTDLVMSAVTDTPQRERTVDFVNYFSAGTAIVVQRGNPAGITDLLGLCGHPVAVERGTIQVDLLARSQKHCARHPIAVKTYDTNADALLQLRTGRASAVLNDYPPAASLSNDPQTRSHYQLASNVQYEPGPYGIAVAKHNPRLRDAIKAALDRLIQSGDYREVLHRWNVTDGALAAASINAGGIAPRT